MIIPAALLGIVVSGCVDQELTEPNKAPRLAREANVPFDKFFVAWSDFYRTGPIQSQVFAVDRRQVRQYAAFEVHQDVLDFARANPGQLYINGDEPDQYCITASDYAVVYHDFVEAVRSADPSARLSPAGVAEPNYHCCPGGYEVVTPCWYESHSIGYMDQFYKAYIQRYGSPPPVNEWRFHDFGILFWPGEVGPWWARVNQEAAWSVAHGANMVLGAFGFNGWRESEAEYQEHLKQAMGLLLNDPRIIEVDYWSYGPWDNSRFPLMNPDGSLTLSGQTYANPLTDVPTGVTAASPTAGRAQLQWTNTTSAWAAEVEFWVQAAGTSSFVYRTTERVAAPGASQSSSIAFNPGEIVKGRVRYYNIYGQAGWSPFSDVVTMSGGTPVAPPAAPPPRDPKRQGSRKSPSLGCILRSCS